jgi:hypothetical protein
MTLHICVYNDPDGKFVSVKKVARGEAPEAVFWTAYGSFGATIVYGHEVHSLTDIRVDKFDDQTACYGIDTGACFGGRLSAIYFEDGKYVDLVSSASKERICEIFREKHLNKGAYIERNKRRHFRADEKMTELIQFA